MSSFEQLYLAANPDVAAAVRDGKCHSGMDHYLQFGKHEGRPLVPVTPPAPVISAAMALAKARKLQLIAGLLRQDLPNERGDLSYDFLSASVRRRYAISETGVSSGNEYDPHVLELIARHENGLVLDVGAGDRTTYLDNVVNFDVRGFDSTDVRGVGEELPFVDNAFDAVVALSVLEHVSDPIRCAAEITRVLKPGGELICCAAFMQPYHGYPNHYFNMTNEGLRRLFADGVEIDRIEVYDSVRPVWSLAWIVNSWADGLDGATRESFLDMRLRDFLKPTPHYLSAPFVTELSAAKNVELASANVLFGRKRRVADPSRPSVLDAVQGYAAHVLAAPSA